MSGEAPNTAGLSGDLGWNEAEERRMGRLSTLLLILTSGSVWSAVWLLRGLVVLPFIGRAALGRRGHRAEHALVNEGPWKNSLV